MRSPTPPSPLAPRLAPPRHAQQRPIFRRRSELVVGVTIGAIIASAILGSWWAAGAPL